MNVIDTDAQVITEGGKVVQTTTSAGGGVVPTSVRCPCSAAAQTHACVSVAGGACK